MSNAKNDAQNADSPLWEVFVQEELGQPHSHAGSLHAADSRLALLNARDVYSRRGTVKSIWVIPSDKITASCPEEVADFFDPANDKIFRYPNFYKSPKGVKNL
jgi:ring-1,2-phenylacetyl-CoA epoxidase subunit PaaB